MQVKAGEVGQEQVKAGISELCGPKFVDGGVEFVGKAWLVSWMADWLAAERLRADG